MKKIAIFGLAGILMGNVNHAGKNINYTKIETKSKEITTIDVLKQINRDLAFLLLEGKAYHSKEPLEINSYAIDMAHDFGKVDEAIMYFKKAINLRKKMFKNGKEIKENLAIYYSNLAIHQELYKKNFKEAEKNYLKAFSLDNSPVYADNLAILYFKTKKYEKAVKYWSYACKKQDKNDKVATYTRIISTLINKLKDYERARKFLDKALLIDKTNPLFIKYKNKIENVKKQN